MGRLGFWCCSEAYTREFPGFADPEAFEEARSTL